MQIGMIGLGKMGGNIARKLLQEGHDVSVWNRSPEKAGEIKKDFSQLVIAKSVETLVKEQKSPRIIWLMLPAGDATQIILDEVSQFIEKDSPRSEAGDIIIDGGNAFYKDTEERYKKFKEKGIRFLGIGVSGGVIAAKTGYPLMVGGDKSAYEYIKPLLNSLSTPNGGHKYFGTGGAGHFVKMIHNGIEYGIMQSLGEGFAVLEKSPYNLDLLDVAKLWQKGTLVSGFMLDRAIDALTQDPKLAKITGYIGISGEADWTVAQAKEEKVAVPIIEASLVYRKQSQTDSAVQNSFTAKLIAALRNAFGGHEVKKSE